MSKQREALEMALLALEIAPLDHNSVKSSFFEKRHYAIIALREALAEPKQEPVAWMSQGGDVSRSKKYFEEMGFTDLIPLYAALPARKPLTEPELHAIEPTWPATWNYDDALAFARAIERAHGIGG